MKVCILGVGSFGTSLAAALAPLHKNVVVWDKDLSVLEGIAAHRENKRYHPGIVLPPNIQPVFSPQEAVEDAKMVLFAVPSHAMRKVALQVASFLPSHIPVIAAAKGIEEGTLMSMTQVLESCLPEPFHPYIAVLSGPSFAREILLGHPTVMTAAARWDRVARHCQRAFASKIFRVDISSDIVGVQIGGALKNVVAIAAGMAEGLGLGHNARAAIMTGGLAEVALLAVRMGGNPITLYGLSGMGDLILTCTGALSRNRSTGFALGKGRKLPEILAELGQVAEGVSAAHSAYVLSTQKHVPMPICHQVYQVLYEGMPPEQAIAEWMAQPTPEF
ncbi:MAG: NAD(P)-dependent glycerol-3-phosphate dehydrogenase [Cystobacterineae bacterium]|nr:NAD(P)-dependent glycerol-3-phosphate dehydrogenase [Cystobacterineae bacterium]